MTFIDEFGKKTVAQLKAYAKANDIDLYGVTTKPQILEVIASFFPEVGKTEEQLEQIKKAKEPIEKIAVYSNKNLYWGGVGTLEIGYNIIAKEMSEKWLTHKAVREASPEEVASYYGK
jgi:hypothetical protein